MNKSAALALLLFSLMLVGQRNAQAGALGVAGDYNVFVFGNIQQWGTDVEGRVAAGGNAIFGAPDVLDSGGNITQYNGFSIASKILNPSLNLVSGANVTLTNGSVGYLEPGNVGSAISQKGEIVYGGSATIVPPVGYGSLQNGAPVDFAAAQSFLTGLSGNLGGLSSNGSATFLRDVANTLYEIDLTGSDAQRNVFNLQASDISQNIAFKFFAPLTSTVIVNIAGDNASLSNVGFSFNDVAGEIDHAAGYPYSHVLFNFLNATDIDIDQVAINGSVLAPFAHIDFGINSHIDGNVIAASLLGQGEVHNMLFAGNVAAVPEPSNMLLLTGGLLVLVIAGRRNNNRVAAC